MDRDLRRPHVTWLLSENTRDDYRKRLKLRRDPIFGRVRLGEIEPRDVKDYVAEMATRGISRNTLRLGVAPVRALFATAVEEGLMWSNPAAGLRLFLQQGPANEAVTCDDVKALAEAELTAVLAAVPARWRLFVELPAQTGMRIGEAIEIRYGDVEFAARWLHVRRRFYRGRVARPKSGKPRRIRLTSGMAEAMLERREAAGAGDTDLVFTSDRGERIDQSNLMGRVLKRAAVEAASGRWVKGPKARRAETWVGFHTFRHTCARCSSATGGTRCRRSGSSATPTPASRCVCTCTFCPRTCPSPRSSRRRQRTGAARRPRCSTSRGATNLRPGHREMAQDRRRPRSPRKGLFPGWMPARST